MGTRVLDDTSTWQVGKEAWDTSSFGLDTLTIKIRGSNNAIDAYAATLTQWSACPVFGAFPGDGNMFLARWPSDDHPNFPTVSLIYIGKRGGILPRTQHSTDNQMQAAKQDVITPTLDLMYMSPTATTVDLARTSDAFSPAIFTDPGKIRLIFSRANLGRIVIPPGLDLSLWFLSYFFTIYYTIPKSTELVPNQYYRNENTTAITLVPIQSS